jgi:glucosylceramidase
MRDIRIKSAGLAMALVMMSGLLCCKDQSNDPPDPPPGPVEIGKAQMWLTRGDKSKLLSKEPDISILDSNKTPFAVVTLDTTSSFQVIEGFGAGLTGSSAFLFHEKMDAAKRAETLKDLFDPDEGIGISYLRLTMGASDFSLSDFSYDDMPPGQTDFDLENFSLDQDLDDVVPVLQEILQIHPDIKLMGTPWSPPAWMKTSNSMKGGKLKPECYDVLARYFARYVKEMESLGIPITSVTPQNEPLYFTAGYPCMEMQATDQADFIKNHLGPTFQAQGIQTKIIVYDHNWDVPQYPIAILNDPEAKQYVSGSAFHAYAGDVSAMSAVHSAHPDKDLYFTEISGGGWATDFSENLMWFMKNILIGTVQNWSATVLFWNLCLNEYDGPQNNGCGNCRGVITYKTYNGQVIKNEEYYAIAHFSKFVRPGAVRLAYNKPASIINIGISAFLNPDGSKAMVVANYNNDSRTFCLNQGGKYFTCNVPGKSVATYHW